MYDFIQTINLFSHKKLFVQALLGYQLGAAVVKRPGSDEFPLFRLTTAVTKYLTRTFLTSFWRNASRFLWSFSFDFPPLLLSSFWLFLSSVHLHSCPNDQCILYDHDHYMTWCLRSSFHRCHNAMWSIKRTKIVISKFDKLNWLAVTYSKFTNKWFVHIWLFCNNDNCPLQICHFILSTSLSDGWF